jgi:hypothetical protein
MNLITKWTWSWSKGIFKTKIIDLGQLKLNIKGGKTLNHKTLNRGIPFIVLHGCTTASNKLSKHIWNNLRYNLSICLEGLRKPTRKLKSGEFGSLPRFTLSTYWTQVRSTAASTNLVWHVNVLFFTSVTQWHYSFSSVTAKWRPEDCKLVAR